MRSTRGRLAASCCVVVAAACLVAGPAAQAATDTYPAGGGTFTGGSQGWQVTEAGCNVPVLCTASGGYDGSNGNPPGSFAANTTIALNLLTLFKSTVTLQSPDFTVSRDGNATLHLDRQFAAGSLIDLAPELTYDVTLLDRTADDKSEPLTETLANEPDFVGKDRAVTVKQGHTYAIVITAQTSSTVAGTGLLSGTTSARFDNVSVTVQTASGGGGKGNGGGGGGGNLTDSGLAALIQGGGLIGPAILIKGNKVSVKVRCPKQVGRTCKIALTGMLTKRKPATTTRKVTVRKGKVKRVVLKVKPKAKARVAKSKRLLFKEKVRAGAAKATVYKRLKLIRR
ncbi:MAG TPA: hypothetical protein VIT89_08260 [Solirubrobacterales bacterium]